MHKKRNDDTRKSNIGEFNISQTYLVVHWYAITSEIWIFFIHTEKYLKPAVIIVRFYLSKTCHLICFFFNCCF